MKIFIAILIFLIGASSLAITFIAIIQILSNDFKESKLQWIVISMIAFIGPILWLTKGRKLIIKRGSNLTAKEEGEKPNLKEHYSKLLKNIDPIIILITIISILLIVYGYLARLLNIYFFWESKSVGFCLLLIPIAIFFLNDIYARKKKHLNRIFTNIVFGFLCLVILIKGAMAIGLPYSDHFKVAKNLLNKEASLKNETGNIHSFSILPMTSGVTEIDSYGIKKKRFLTIIIKGEEKYVEKDITLYKEYEKDWGIISID